MFVLSRWAAFLCRQARPARQLSPGVASYWVIYWYLVATCRQARLGDRDYVKISSVDVLSALNCS
ncbi:hypothetical protein A2U01_0102753 [Trifolium medium]|uniref:Uncharacterized protein n=1 Tax=Trifolium medium TaxID=97028 RepID=A0A392V2L7_9FABA|nr:hypothetical protein [Trifolium medium]